MIFFQEILDRYAAAVISQSHWLLLGLLAFIVLGVQAIRRQWNGTLFFMVIVLTLALGWAWHLRWLCDDAFISFRYAKNLVEGHGLVFNVGEKVEGYTNFLWTLLMALMIFLKQDPGQASLILSLIFFAGTLLLVFRMVRLFSSSQDSFSSSVVLAPILLGANYIFASYATSGLETMFATFLITAAVERAFVRKFFVSGLLAVAALLAHPDHALFYFSLGLVLLLDSERRKGIVFYGIPFLFIYTPYFLIRWHYYGDFWPNTYYAKSGGDFYWGQGVIYLFASVFGGGLWSLLPLLFYELSHCRKNFLSRYVFIATPLYLLYVAKIGGDFMYGRLLCPLIPAWIVLAEIGLRRLLLARYRLLAFPALILLVFTILPVRLIQPWEKKWFLADERTFYELQSFSPIRVGMTYFGWSEILKRHFVDHHLFPLFAVDCVGMVGYYTGLPLIDNFGLTDRTVAHQAITVRGRPGHEKFSTPEYIKSRGAALSEHPVYVEPYSSLTRISLEGVVFHIVFYDTKLLSILGNQPGVQFIDFSNYLNDYLFNSSLKTSEQIRRDFTFFKEYYFSKNEDPERHQLLSQLAGI